MVFDPGTFQDGVGPQQSPVTELLDPFVITDEQIDRLIQQIRAGGFDVFNPLASVQQVTSEYVEIPSVLSIRKGNRILAATDHFILGSFNEADQEKMSFVFTFGEPILFGGMGRRPRLFSYSGFLKDSLIGGKGISGWMKMYDKYLRGTKCRQSGAVADLRFRDQNRIGYIVSANMSYEEARTQVAPFSFTMFIIKSDP